MFDCVYQCLDVILRSFISPISADKADDELEITTVCYRPEGLEQLEAQTNFTKQELQILYRGFKNVIDYIITPNTTTRVNPKVVNLLYFFKLLI